MQAASLGETLIGLGQFTGTVAVAAANTVIKPGPGRICRAVVTTAGTTAFTVFDNATTNSGTVLFAIGTVASAVGAIFDIQMPAQAGITIQNTAAGPGLTVSFD